ncbi:UbiA family prenyltransferase [Ekhidna lutea]|uniref:UbiA family prenyltransferase n=1 Tax=Ekhidna lutea TaxID=447679 RepID=UPI001FE66B8E|nr:UbiA family prenyltransferase [Ekhidna lutea]
MLPVFLLALSVSYTVNTVNLLLAFIILHFLVYPASNGYNSYFDKDEKSIGGLKHPPKVTKELYWVSLVLDGLGLVLSFLISMEFLLMILIYGLISKAYSHPSIRLKKFPIMGWLAAGIFQGYFTFLLSFIAINDLMIHDTLEWSTQIPGILSTLLLLGSYPMTQIYQHDEDAKRGDTTISQKLGILGTFHFTAISFSISTVGFLYYFIAYYSFEVAIIFAAAMMPVLLFFGRWYLRVRKDSKAANFESTMRLNLISSLMLNGFFVFLWLS